MTTWITSFNAGATLLAVALLAQDNPAAKLANASIPGLPAGRGVYYHAPLGWVALRSALFMPIPEDRAVMEFLNVGSGRAVAEMLGSQANVQIGNDARPTFYLRGISPADLYLVRTVQKGDYREVVMPISRHFREWAQFRAKDLAEIDLQAVAAGIVTVKPRSDLKPGEYTLASTETANRWIRLSYDFGLTANTARH